MTGLTDLAMGLEEQRWEVVRNEEFSERVQETLCRIDDLLELSGLAPMGARYASGRWPGKAVRKGLEERRKEKEGKEI